MKKSFYRIIVIPILAIIAHANNDDHVKNMTMSRALFENDIKPIFKEHCLKCHGGEKTKSSFDLSSRESLIAGGDQGNAIIVGKPDQSPLIDYLRHNEEPFMPPKEPKLPEKSISLIEQWISLGAAYDSPLVRKENNKSGPMKVTNEDRNYWAYSPLKSNFENRNKIDDFVKTNQTASPRVLSRRLHFDLIGLPPKPDQLDKFVNNFSEQKYKSLVESLLSSPKFGERWARHWLDVARFGESHGFEQDYDRKFAFH